VVFDTDWVTRHIGRDVNRPGFPGDQNL
jgi:hypothetical protein